MKRRDALQRMAVLAGGLITLPAWAKGWTPESIPLAQSPFLPPTRDLITRIVGAIIPESEIPGAVSLGVPAFVETMLADCYEKKVQENVESGLLAVERRAQTQYAKPFAGLSLAEQQALLLSIETSDDTALKDCYDLLKNLTIQGYTTSEYVQTTFLEYEMAPGHYYGCVPVK